MFSLKFTHLICLLIRNLDKQISQLIKGHLGLFSVHPWPLFAHPNGCWVLTIRLSLGSKNYIPFEVWLIRVWVCVMMSVVISPQYRLLWRPPVESFPFYITHGMSLRKLPVTVIQRGTWLPPRMIKWIFPCKNK